MSTPPQNLEAVAQRLNFLSETTTPFIDACLAKSTVDSEAVLLTANPAESQRLHGVMLAAKETLRRTLVHEGYNMGFFETYLHYLKQKIDSLVVLKEAFHTMLFNSGINQPQEESFRDFVKSLIYFESPWSVFAATKDKTTLSETVFKTMDLIIRYTKDRMLQVREPVSLDEQYQELGYGLEKAGLPNAIKDFIPKLKTIVESMVTALTSSMGPDKNYGSVFLFISKLQNHLADMYRQSVVSYHLCVNPQGDRMN